MKNMIKSSMAILIICSVVVTVILQKSMVNAGEISNQVEIRNIMEKFQ